MAKLYITAIRLSGGKRQEHITHVWISASSVGAQSDASQTVAEMVLRINKGEEFVVLSGKDEAKVMVVNRPPQASYIRTVRDETTKDNLLSLTQR